MKRQLSSIVQEYGYDNVREFYSDYYASKGEYEKYNIREVEKWKKKNEKSEDRSSIDKKVYYNQFTFEEFSEEFRFLHAKCYAFITNIEFLKRSQTSL